MRNVKCVLSILKQDLRKWTEDYRLRMVALLIIVLCIDNAHGVAMAAEYYGTKSSIWTFPFIYSQHHMKLLFTFPLILLFCNAPFVDNNKLMILSRTGGRRYLIGQILYIAAASFIYYLFIWLCTIITTLPNAELAHDWGDILYTVSYCSTIIYNDDVSFFDVSGYVLNNYTPIAACLYTVLMSWLNAVMMGMIIFASNIFSPVKYLGISICGGLICLSNLIINEGTGWVYQYWFSPVSWNTINVSGIKGPTGNPHMSYCIAVYASVIVLLGAAVIIFGKRKILKMEVS